MASAYPGSKDTGEQSCHTGTRTKGTMNVLIYWVLCGPRYDRKDDKLEGKFTEYKFLLLFIFKQKPIYKQGLDGL